MCDDTTTNFLQELKFILQVHQELLLHCQHVVLLQSQSCQQKGENYYLKKKYSLIC